MFTVDKYKWFDQLRSIFSIDLISDGTKFAIAQGSIISLWRFPQDSAVMSISTTKEINNNKFACTAQTLEYDFSNLLISRLNHHTKSVNILRFSETGNFLAAGSDDACVSISKKEYVIGSQHVEKDGTSNSLSSSAGERWRCVKGLQQENEVYSLAWSPDSSRLATGSVNKKIRIYDANNDFGKS